MNCAENRYLKKALIFVNRYLSVYFQDDNVLKSMLTPTLNYCLSSFQDIDDNVNDKFIRGFKNNVFFKEYNVALHLAEQILRRFGYNIKSITDYKIQYAKVPPFWIDMSKLFELYVLGQLKEKYFNRLLYGSKDAGGNYGLPDYLLFSEHPMIIDAKYKPSYQTGQYDIEDIRQLSGYSRDKGVLAKLGIAPSQFVNSVVNCMVIYPDQSSSEDLFENTVEPIIGFVNFYKRAVRLPQC